MEYESNDADIDRLVDLRRELDLLPSDPGDEVVHRRRKRLLEADIADLEGKLIATNKGLVVATATPFIKGATEEDTKDYLQAGAMGLLLALRRFDRSRGSFASWAILNIKREVQNAVREREFHELPERMFAQRARLNRAIEELTTTKPGEAFTPEQVAELSLIPVETVRRLMEYQRAASLETDLTRPEIRDVFANITRHDETVTELVADELWWEYTRKALEGLTPQEVFVLTSRELLPEGESYSLDELGDLLGVSRETVRKVEKRAKDKVAEKGMKLPRSLE
jgi:RNA polymerase primary sigma factor